MLLDDLVNLVVDNDWLSVCSSIYYKRTFSDLLIDCHNALEERNPVATFLQLPRLMRLVLDDYADNLTDSLKQRSNIDSVAKVIVAGFTDYSDLIDGLDLPFSDDFIVYEPDDSLTLACLNPNYLKNYLSVINDYFNGDGFVLSNLGNGSSRVALLLMPYLNQVIDYVPFRLSCYKHKDVKPVLSINDLKRLNSGRLFITDEDCSSGHTLRVCDDYLNEMGVSHSFGCVVSIDKPLKGGVIPDVYAVDFKSL